MANVNPDIWGTQSTWVQSILNPSIWIVDDNHKLSDLYYYNNDPVIMELGEPIDTTPAFWGWGGNSSWSTWHCRSVNNGAVQDTAHVPDGCRPVMGWDYGSYGSAYYTYLPRTRTAYDNVADTGIDPDYDKEYAWGGLTLGNFYLSKAWMDFSYMGFCTCPVIDYFKIDEVDGFQLYSDLHTGYDRLDSALTLISAGWTPCKIDMGDYVSGDPTGQTQRYGIQPWGSLFPTLVGMGDVRLTPDLYNYYKSTPDPSDVVSDDRMCLTPDSPDVMFMTPAIPFGLDRYLDATASVESNEGRWMTVGGHVKTNIDVYKTGMKVVYLRYTTTPQDFSADDGVVYHWEIDTCDDDGNPVDLTQTSGNVHTYCKLVVDSKSEEDTMEQALYKAILHECAFFGTKFAKNVTLNTTGDLTSNSDGIGLYIPVFTDQMHTTGLYHTGEDFANDPNVNASSVRAFDFEPDIPTPDDPGEDVPGGHSGNWNYSFGSFTIPNNNQYYVLGAPSFQVLCRFIKSTYEKPDDPDHIQHSNLEWNGIDCTDWITTVKFYPFDVPKEHTSVPVKIGFIPVTDSSSPDPEAVLEAPLYKYNTSDCTYNLGSFTLNDSFLGKNFRSTALAKVWLKLPFHGDFELDLGRYFDTTVSIGLICDFVTGTGCYLITAGGVLFDCVDVNIGMDMPLTGYNMGTYQNTMRTYDSQLQNARWSKTVGLGSNIATGVVGIASGNPWMVATSALGAVNNVGSGSISEQAIEYNLSHTSPSGGIGSTASAFCGLVQDLTVRVVIARPKCQTGYSAENPTRKDAYAKTVGYACVKSGKLNTFSGLTVCSGYNASSIACTGAERELIVNALNSGVIV